MFNVASNLFASYPRHPDTIIITAEESFSGQAKQEKDVYSYYEGIKNEMLKEFKDRDLFIRMKTDNGFIILRHPFGSKEGYIKIDDAKDFDKYNTGRVVEYHVNMPNMCPYYIIDYDAVGTWKHVKDVTAELADGLGKLPEVREVELRFSGKRGFHVLGWLRKPIPIAEAHDKLKEWLKENFSDRDDVVVQESPSGNRGALGIAPMKRAGGQTALWSLRLTGLCCVRVPRNQLATFEKEDASMENTYKKLTGRSFKAIEPKRASVRNVVSSYLNMVKI